MNEEFLKGWNYRIAYLKENGVSCLEHNEDLAADAELDRLRDALAAKEEAERCYADVVLSFDDAADQADNAKKELAESVAAIETWKEEAAYWKNQAGITLERADKLEVALRSIAGAVGEFADADGKNIVEKIEFLRKDYEERAEKAEGALCSMRERDKEATKLIMAVVGNSLLNDPIFERLLKRARAFYENPSVDTPCPHELAEKRLREEMERRVAEELRRELAHKSSTVTLRHYVREKEEKA